MESGLNPLVLSQSWGRNCCIRRTAAVSAAGAGKGWQDTAEVMSQDGRREIVLNGEFVRIHPEASDEGVWIETRMGERLLTGEPNGSH